MPSATVLHVSSHPADKARVASALGAIRGQPYRLEVTSTMADALARIKHGRVDAILLDLTLPDSSGLTTLLRLQPKATHIPIVVLVDPGEEDMGGDAVSRGALDFLVRDHLTTALVERVLRYATERTHTMLALKASEQRYRELFQNVTAGVFQTTAEGKFMAANPALVRLLGYALRGRAARTRRRPRRLLRSRPSPELDQGDARGRRDPQRRAGAEAQGRIQDRRAGEFPRRAATPTGACCSTKAPSPTSRRPTSCRSSCPTRRATTR